MGSQWVGGKGSEADRKRVVESWGWGWGFKEGWGDYWGSREGYRENERGSRELSLRIDTNDWRVGVYRGEGHWYLCLVPMIAIRWKRFRKRKVGRMINDAGDDNIIDLGNSEDLDEKG